MRWWQISFPWNNLHKISSRGHANTELKALGRQRQEIRGGIEKNLGKRVWMKSHRGRSKCVENVGILEHSFPSIFTILIEEHGQEKRISYGYNELFTRQLEMKYLE